MRKRTFPIVVLLLCALTMILTACGLQTTVTKLQGISVNVDNMRTEYITGDELSLDGMVVTAQILSANEVVADDVILDESEYQVNTASYNKYQPGSYKIKVSYTFGGVTMEDSFIVTVAEREYDGISVKLSEGVSDTYHLTEPVVIDTTKITVQTTDAFGNLLDGEAEGYETSLYKGKHEIALVDGKATINEGGAYQIWVEKQSDTQALYTLKAFVTVYVLDDVKTLTFNQTESTVLTQTKGDDVMTETWTFTVTYESGKTKTVTAEDVEFSALVDTGVVGKDVSVAATYTEKNAKSQNVTTSEATVTYTVTAPAAQTEKTVFVNASDITAATYTEETKIGDGVYIMATAAKTVVVEGNSKNYGEISFTNRIKLGGAGSVSERSIKIVAEGKGTVSIYAITSSSGDLTRKAVFADATGKVLKESEGLPNAVTKVTFDIPEAGTYYVYGSASINLYGVEVVTAAAQTEKTVFVNASDITAATYTEETKIGDGVYIMATAAKTVVVEGNSKNYGEISFTNRIKLGGAGSIEYISIKVVAEGKGTVNVYAITGSSSATDRTLAFVDATGTKLDESEGLPNAVTKVTFDIPKAGTYYIYSTNKGINLYGVEVVTTAAAQTEKTVFVNASDITAATYTEETKIGDGVYIMATAAKTVVVEGNSKNYGEISFTNRIKLGGAGSVSERSIKIVAEGKGTVSIYAITSSSGDLTRKAVFADATGKVLKESEGLPNAVTKVTFDIPEAGTYYVYGSASINLYGVEVICNH